MQPVIAVLAREAGILYLNGHFAGEVDPQNALIRPIACRGPMILEYRPYSERFSPMTRRFVFSDGVPMPPSAEESEGMGIVVWSGNITEIELVPRLPQSGSRTFEAFGNVFSMENRRLYRGGRDLCALPDGASVPEPRNMPFGTALIGDCADGRYLLTFADGFSAQTGALIAERIEIEPDGRVRSILNRGDTVGHGVLETWRCTESGLQPISSESVWIDGAPQWPKTPVETVQAYVEACLAGLDSEAEGYLSPTLRGRFSCESIRERCDLCVEMKYAPSEARPCVGLLKMSGEALAHVTPLYFRASASGGIQGAYTIEELTFADSANTDSTRI